MGFGGLGNIDSLKAAREALGAGAAAEKMETAAARQEANAVSMQADLQSEGRDDIASKISSKQASVAKMLQDGSKVRKLPSAEKPAALREIKKIDDSLEKFTKNNEELEQKKNTIKRLLTDIEGKSATEILEMVQNEFREPENANQVFLFLIENTVDEKTKTALEEAHRQYAKANGSQIIRGNRILQLQQEAAGYAGATELRQVYRDIRDKHDPVDLFKNLANKYTEAQIDALFDLAFRKLRIDINKPGIERAELQTLLDETKTLQASKWTMKVFQGSDRRITYEFHRLEEPLHYK